MIYEYKNRACEPANFIFSENWKKYKHLSMFLWQSFVLHPGKIDHMFLETLN